MKKVISIITVLFSVFFGALLTAPASTRYTENWGTGTALVQGNGDLNMLGWTGIAQSQTAQPYLGTFANNGASDPQFGPLPANTVYFTGLTGTFQANGPGMFYTISGVVPTFGSSFTNLDPTLITNLTFNVEVVNSGGNTTNYFAVNVGGAWYVALGNQLPVTGVFTNWTMQYTNLASVWNTLAIDASQTFVTIGATAGANLSGPITGVGIVSMNNTNIGGTPGLNYNRIVINQGIQDFPTLPATNTVAAVNPLAVYAGGGVSFAPSFSGSPTLAFNWQTNGTNIGTGANLTSPTGTHYLGAQTTRLTITNISPNDAVLGITNFSVVVTNFFGAATNTGITLAIVTPPSGLLYAEVFPSIGSGGNNSLPNVGWTSVSAGSSGQGAGVFAQNGNGNNLAAGTVGGGIADEFTFGATGLGTNACYTTIANDFGLSGLPFPVINPASYPAITIQCAFGGNAIGATRAFWMVQMTDPVGVTTNWFVSAAQISPLGGYLTNQLAFSTVASNWNTLTIVGQIATPGGQAASNLVGNITGAGMLFIHSGVSTVNFQNFAITTNPIPIFPPTIGADYPIDTTVASGGGASFGVATVSGTPPYTYGWTTNGVPVSDGGRVSGSATATLTIANLNANDSGMQIIAYVTNSTGSDSSDVFLGVPTTLTVTNPAVSVLYSEVFPFVGPVTANYPISGVGWTEAVPGTPNSIFRRGTAGTVTQGDGAAFAFLGSSNTTIYYTTTATDHNQSGLPFPNINLASYAGSLGFSVDISPTSTPSNVLAYVAIQLNGANWYVAATALPVPTATASGTFATYTMAFDPTAANWKNLTLNANNVTIGAAAAGNLSGVMTGAGLVFATVGAGGTFDFDNFQITGTGVGGGLGGVNAGSVTGGSFNLSWVGNPAVSLQSTTNLTLPFQDVPNTLGLYSFPVSVTNPPQQFFRLVQH